jgi:hypothetical protein
MIYVAIIENNVVTNIVVEADNWQNPNDGTAIVYDMENPASIGWLVVNGVIINPDPTPELPNPPIIPV